MDIHQKLFDSLKSNALSERTMVMGDSTDLRGKDVELVLVDSSNPNQEFLVYKSKSKISRTESSSNIILRTLRDR